MSETESGLHKFTSAENEWHWRFLLLKAKVLVQERRDRDSLAILEQEIPSSVANCDLVVWRKLTQGSAKTHLLQYKDADRYLGEAEETAKAHCPNLLGEVYLRKGTLANLSDDFGVAESNYRDTLRIARQQNDSFLEIAALGSLAVVATKRGHYDESIDWNRQALQLSRSVHAESSISKIYGNLGWSYFEMGDFENALVLYQQAEEAAAKVGLAGDRVYWRMNIGNVNLAQRNYASARLAYEKALDFAKNLGDEKSTAEGLENLALVALETGQTESAQHFYDSVVQFVRAYPDPYVELNALIIGGRIAQIRREYAQAEQSFQHVVHDPNAGASLRWEAAARLAEVYVAEGRPKNAENEFRQSIATIEKARSSIDREELRLPFLTSAIAFYDDYVDFLISQGRTEDALQVAEVSRAQTLAEGLGLSSKISFPLPNFQPQSIAQRFGATLLFYWLGEKHSYFWAATRSGVRLFTLPPASEIEALIKPYREALLGPRNLLETANAQGIKLYELLVAPAQKLIPPGSRVIVLPDGGLYDLNFETLLVPTPTLHYWIEDAVVANANSLVLLAASANERPARLKKLLLIGDPLSPNAEFPDLPQAAAEMGDVERYFAAPDRTVLSRQRATAAAYLSSRPAQYSFIHFVAHGTASRASPLDSAVILTKEGDSYKLYARDIVLQPLNADLVTISACHGAGERTYSGEGLVGLTWAFLRAGAHGVIAALWEVNDNSTPALMDDLYGEIKKGSAPDVALRHAKLKLLHSGTVYQKPFYWAPFELYRGH
ncbi:MAG: CHAT domain-containing tetratricopeptide repeat protein [Candidatus Acidiferrales bacterium]